MAITRDRKPKQTSDTNYFTEQSVYIALCKLFPSPAHAVLRGVKDAVGMGGVRTADAVVMSCYPSRGLWLHGVEIKVSRSDWIRELKEPEKAESVARYCDRWFLAIGENGIVQEGELPEGWGLIAPCGPDLAVVKQPAKAKADPMPREFLASLLRRAAEASNNLTWMEIDRIKKEAVEQFKASQGHQVDQRLERAESDLAELREHVRQFQNASGLIFPSWDGGKKLGEAVQAVLTGHHRLIPRHYENMIQAATFILKFRDEHAGLHKSESEG